MNQRDELFMRRAFQLAQNGIGRVSPNPMVGCVIVKDEQIIGEGWHQKYGEGHAEVNAVNSVSDKLSIRESTFYVTLEPCAHFGKTPPCADLLVSLLPRRVVIANLDPNPLVAGKGIEKLKKAGIEVECGLLADVGWELNRRFFTCMTQKRPYIILKWAETADGFIARKNFDSKWISNSFSRLLVHKWRTEETAILVGTNTARYDNPKLNAREWSGNQPIRVVIDKNLQLPNTLHLFDQSQPTLVYNLNKEAEQENLIWVKLPEEEFISLLINDLYKRKIQSLFVEGGSFLLNTLLALNFWDELRVFKSQEIFSEGIKAPSSKGKLIKTENYFDNTYFEYRNV
jgi:diaminohydroxyphosphoribosylaminopyrimidine deaminase/5-amino-6-(5-phosphoribosylamino)uracil reductase